MKILDRDGRLFGLINIFDLIVLLMLVTSGIFGFMWFTVAEDPSWVRIEHFYTRCLVQFYVQSYIVEYVKEGDKMVNSEGVVELSLLKIIKTEPSSTVVYASKEGEKLFFTSDTTKFTAEMDLLSYRKKGELLFAVSGNPLKCGSAFAITTDKYKTSIEIVKILTTNGK